MASEYEVCRELPPHLQRKIDDAAAKRNGGRNNRPPSRKALTASASASAIDNINDLDDGNITRKLIQGVPASAAEPTTSALAIRHKSKSAQAQISTTTNANLSSTSLINRNLYVQDKPEWHAPWKLMRVISGHLGWVRSVCVEPDNQWFATGSTDRTIKIWDLASGTLKLSLTGHIMGIRGLAVSNRHPYLFSGGEDKLVKCWDLEMNKVIRHYHGHLSGVYSLDLHPTLDLLVSAGNDAVARVWDIRTREPVHVLQGHKAAISQVRCQEADPQVITTSMDSTVRLWDLAAGKTQTVLTHHKKAVRALAIHPEEFTFATGSPDNIKEWKCPEGTFIHNFYPKQQQEGNDDPIINTLAVNADGIMYAGGDNGSMGFYDWKTGHKFQSTSTVAGPGSLEAENGIFASAFDKTGMRLITCEADKSIKIWREDEKATVSSHPGVPWQPRLGKQTY